MAVPSALRDRFTRWCDELDAYGYEFAAPKRAARSGGEFVIGARRPTTYGGPAVVIEIKELWSPGGDPHGVPAAPLASPERWLEEVETCVDGVY